MFWDDSQDSCPGAPASAENRQSKGTKDTLRQSLILDQNRSADREGSRGIDGEIVSERGAKGGNPPPIGYSRGERETMDLTRLGASSV